MKARAALFGLFCASSAAAETPASIRVESSVACPSAAQLEAEIQPLLPETHLSPSSTEIVRVESDARGLVVSVRDQTKTLDPSEQDCHKLARLAAVFVTLTLDPPDFAEETTEPTPRPVEPKKEESPPPREAATPRTSSSTDWPWSFEASAWTEVASGGDPSSPPVLGGALLRARSGRWWGASFGGGFSFDSTWSFDDDRVRVRTVPLDVSAFVVLTRGAFELSPELGLAAPIWVSQSLEFEQPEQIRLQLGARAALSARLWLNETWGVTASLSATLFPRPYSFVVLPSEILGETPSLWLGASLGVALRLDPS